MKRLISLSLVTFVFSIFPVEQAQSPETDPITRPRSVEAAKSGKRAQDLLRSPAQQTQEPARKSEGAKPADKVRAVPAQNGDAANQREETNGSSSRLSPSRIRARINEAERLLKSRPTPTALTTSSLDYVTLAAFLPETSQIHLIRLAKQNFLTKGYEIPATTSLGLPVSVRVVRANGVNTAVTIFDAN